MISFSKDINYTTLVGYKIVVHNGMPSKVAKMVLSEDVLVTDEYRIKYNKWLLEFFGEETYYVVLEKEKIIICASENYMNLVFRIEDETRLIHRLLYGDSND